jgi:hypothetical protein
MTVLPVPSQLRSLIYDLAERLTKLPALGALRRQIPAWPQLFWRLPFRRMALRAKRALVPRSPSLYLTTLSRHVALPVAPASKADPTAAVAPARTACTRESS